MEVININIPPGIIKEQARILLRISGVFSGELEEIMPPNFKNRKLKAIFLAYMLYRFKDHTVLRTISDAFGMHTQSLSRIIRRMKNISEKTGEHEFSETEIWKKLKAAESSIPSIFETKIDVNKMLDNKEIDPTSVKAQRKKRPKLNRFERIKIEKLRRKIAQLFELDPENIFESRFAKTMYTFYLSRIFPELAYDVLIAFTHKKKDKTVFYHHKKRHFEYLSEVNKKVSSLSEYRNNDKIVKEFVLTL